MALTLVVLDGSGGGSWGAYDPWGNASFWPPPSIGYYRWNGAWGYLRFDALGLYYVHERWYSPNTGLFLSPDENGEYLYGSGQDAINWAWFWCWLFSWWPGCNSATSTPTPISGATQTPYIILVPVTTTPAPTNTATATPTLAPATRGTEEYELAKMMWFEERNQGQIAMRAAGWVAVNRIGQPRDDGSRRNFPGTLQEVLDEPGQFQGYERNRNTDPAILVANRDPSDRDRQAWGWAIADAPNIVARRIEDPTGGAKYFGNNVRAQMDNCRQTVPGFEYRQIEGTTLFVSNKPYMNCPVPTPTRRR